MKIKNPVLRFAVRLALLAANVIAFGLFFYDVWIRRLSAFAQAGEGWGYGVLSYTLFLILFLLDLLILFLVLYLIRSFGNRLLGSKK